jgi:hypothetical protein
MSLKVKEFMQIAGQLPNRGEFNVRQTALQIGLVLEEMYELLDALKTGSSPENYKSGKYDIAVINCDRTEVLDAFLDIAWVAIGGAYAMGADVEGAMNALNENNLSKFPECLTCEGTGTVFSREGSGVLGERWHSPCPTCSGNKRVVIRDENGKVVKPNGYKKLDLEEFL